MACVALVATGAGAQTLPAAPGAGGASGDSTLEPAIESARRAVRLTVEWLASGVDGWFGDRPFDKGGKVGEGEVRVGVLQRQDSGVDLKLRFAATVRLPNIEHHTYLYFGRDNLRGVVSDQPQSVSRREELRPETAQNRAFFAGLGRAFGDALSYRIGFRGGLKPYAQARYQRDWVLGDADALDFRQTFFWSVDDRFGSTTALALEHGFSPTLVGRWLASATITRERAAYDWHTTAGVYRSLGRSRVVAAELLASGNEGAGIAVTEYGVQARWQQPVVNDDLLAELTVAHFWPRPTAAAARTRAWAVGGALTLRF